MDRPIHGTIVDLRTPNRELVSNKYLGSHFKGNKLFMLLSSTTGPQLIEFDLAEVLSSGSSEEAPITLGEFYALLEEGVSSLKEMHKLTASAALSPAAPSPKDPDKRKPGRPRKEPEPQHDPNFLEKLMSGRTTE